MGLGVRVKLSRLTREHPHSLVSSQAQRWVPPQAKGGGSLWAHRKPTGSPPVGERQLCPETFPCPAWGREQGTHRATFLWVPEVQFKAA